MDHHVSHKVLADWLPYFRNISGPWASMCQRYFVPMGYLVSEMLQAHGPQCVKHVLDHGPPYLEKYFTHRPASWTNISGFLTTMVVECIRRIDLYVSVIFLAHGQPRLRDIYGAWTTLFQTNVWLMGHHVSEMFLAYGPPYLEMFWLIDQHVEEIYLAYYLLWL